VHHADTAADRLARAGKADLTPLDPDRAAVSVVQAVDDIHQRALAGGLEFRPD